MHGFTPLSFNLYNFDCFSANNEKYESSYTVTPEPKFSPQVYAGGSTEGYAVFLVKKDDINPKIAYGLKYDGSGGIWFNLQ
jgi:hypothetical protein